MELFDSTEPLNVTNDEAVNEELNELLNALNDAMTGNYQDGLSHVDTDFSDKAVTELFGDTEPLDNVTNETVNEESNELLNVLNDAMTEDYQGSISHGLIFDTDSSNEESDVSSLKITLEKGFSIRRKQTENQMENDNKILCKLSWECSCAGKYQPKKVLNPNDQRNRQSRTTDCKWRVNGNLPKNATLITFTTVVDKHNHPMVPLPATNIARYCKLGDDMVEFIEFCVHYGVTSTQSIGRLLKGKFPGRKIYQKGLYNSIQIAKKKTVSQVEFDASDLMRHLYSHRTEDSRWFVEAKFEKDEHRLFPSNFENQWESLKAKYTSISSYIKWQLDPFRHKWAICYTNNQFTTSANSTQWVESLNCKIHDRVRSSSSLLNLTKEIQELFDKESEFAKIEEYKEQIPTIGLPTITKTYFSSLEKIEHINNDNIEGTREDNYEIAKIYLSDIMSTIRQDQIEEIWRVVISCGIKNNYVILLADGSHRCTCNMIITHGNIWQQSPITICVNSNQNQSPSNVEPLICKFDYLKQTRSTEVYNPILKDVNNKRQIYGRAQGIIRKALDIAIATSSYNELMGICHRFILDKQESQEDSDTTTDDDDIEYDIKNP
ncbi:18319_t:CDS:2, partial [Gigaspora margarita]